MKTMKLVLARIFYGASAYNVNLDSFVAAGGRMEIYGDPVEFKDIIEQAMYKVTGNFWRDCEITSSQDPAQQAITEMMASKGIDVDRRDWVAFNANGWTLRYEAPADEWQLDAEYQAQYAHACGYHD